MKSLGENKFFRFFVYFLELYIFYCLEQTPGLTINCLDARPIFLVSSFISIAVWEKEFFDMILGAVCGVFMDMSFGTPFGTCILIFGLFGYSIGVLSNYFMNLNFWIIWTLCATVNIVVIFLVFCFNFINQNYEGVSLVWNSTIVPCIIYSILTSPIIFLLNRSIRYFMVNSSGGEQDRI